MTDDCSKGNRDCARRTFSRGGSEPDPETLDVLFEAAADRRTRSALSVLESSSVDVMDLDDLVDHVVQREVDAGLAADDDHRERVAIALHHSALPKLDDAAVLDYDPRSNVVRYWGDDAVAALLDVCESDDCP